ncbi:MAG: alpha/beta hydrolase [Eubacterium sp.]|nr:alpha/beta hydrolase [Eubacterium sp.]
MEEKDYKKILVDFWETIEENGKNKNETVKPEGWRMEKHVPYIMDYNVDHMMNLYYPKDFTGEEKLPTIINIHGGGWMFSHIDDSENYMAFLASEGFAVMGMGYRLLQTGDLQCIVSDIFESLHWLEKYGSKRGFDLNRVLITGDSAGGHLALLTACIMQSRKLQEAYNVEPVSFKISTVSASCPCPLTDKLYILEDDKTDIGRGTAEAYNEFFLGKQGKNAPWDGHMSFADTIKDVKAEGNEFPPVFIIGSENESLNFQTKLLKEVMEENGLKYEVLEWKKDDGGHLYHVFNIEHWEWYESLLSNRTMLEYFRSNF